MRVLHVRYAQDVISFCCGETPDIERQDDELFQIQSNITSFSIRNHLRLLDFGRGGSEKQSASNTYPWKISVKISPNCVNSIPELSCQLSTQC